MIIEQKYDSDDWIKRHFLSLLEAFKDDRYIRVAGKVLFMIYRPLEYDGVVVFMNQWRALAKENDLGDFYFVGQATNDLQANEILKLGFDGVNIVRKDDYMKHLRYNNFFVKFTNKIKRLFCLMPYKYDYAKISKYFVDSNGIETKSNVFPTIIPNWDHSPRSGKSASVFYNSTPKNFDKHVADVLKVVTDKKEQDKIVFLKSWNEWGEGNYVEPCLKYEKGYIETLAQRLK